MSIVPTQNQTQFGTKNVWDFFLMYIILLDFQTIKSYTYLYIVKR